MNPRQQEVVDLILAGHSNKIIAKKLIEEREGSHV